jgi:hypothetical protein
MNPDTGSTVRKVTVNFAPETYETLRSISETRGITMSEVLRQAISLMAFYVETTKNAKILIDREGHITELRLL